jgi:predicted RNase H-like HicB family nuclease
MTDDERPHYSMVIEWDPRDSIYVVSFPEWAAADVSAHIHGATYEEAAAKGRDLLEFLIQSAQAEGESLPIPRTFASASASPAATWDVRLVYTLYLHAPAH